MPAKNNNDSSYYEILELNPTASGRDVHMAYMRAKETYSPDSPALYTMFTPEEARQLLKMIDEAFTVLSNQAKRQEYDLSLARKGHPAFANLLRAKPTVVRAVESGPRADHFANEAAGLNKLRVQHTGELPAGFARTRFSVYEVNSTFEAELKTIEECDGAYIQKIRQYRKVSLDQLSDATRISKNNLSALESNAYDSLPAPVFVRGFVLQVARTLGVPDRIADAYMKHLRKIQS